VTDNPWAPWGIIFSRRDGYPALSEAALWLLMGAHPNVVERVSPTETYVHLDQPYRLVDVTASYRWCIPVPGRKPPVKAV
jgi:hypothetical protein